MLFQQSSFCGTAIPQVIFGIGMLAKIFSQTLIKCRNNIYMIGRINKVPVLAGVCSQVI